MSFLIDGHNLIPKIPGLSLKDMDDEQALVEILKSFCHANNCQVEVYFDKAPPGYAGKRQYGPVAAIFIHQGSIADEAIMQRLRALGKQARNYTVVTSDHRIQAEAHDKRAKVINSDEFARRITSPNPAARARKAVRRLQGRKHTQSEAPLSEQEVKEWLRLFEENNE